MRELKSVIRLIPILGFAIIPASIASDLALAQCDVKGGPPSFGTGDSTASVDSQSTDGETDLNSQIELFKGGEVVVLTVPCSSGDMPIAARVDSVKSNRSGPTNLIPFRSPAAGGAAGDGPTDLIPSRPRVTEAALRDAPARLVPPPSPLAGTSLGDGSAGGGVRVLSVERGSPAWRGGLRTADVIESVDRTPVGDVAELGRALDATGTTAVLQVHRNGKEVVVVLHR